MNQKDKTILHCLKDELRFFKLELFRATKEENRKFILEQIYDLENKIYQHEKRTKMQILY